MRLLQRAQLPPVVQESVGTFVYLFERDKLFYDLKSGLHTEVALLASPGHRQRENNLNSSRVTFCGHSSNNPISVCICATLWFKFSEDILSSLLA